MRFQDFADAVHDGHAGVERDRRRHRGAYPKVALFERRQELRAEPRPNPPADEEKDEAQSNRQPPPPQCHGQHGRVDGMGRPYDHRFGLPHVLRKQKRGQNGRDREGREQRAGQRIGIGARHRIEDLAFHALHGEKRHEGGQDDQRREQDRGFDLACADVDQPDSGQQALVVGAVRKPGRAPQQLLTLAGLKHAENILDKDHRGIDDDAEIDRAEGEQVGVLAAHHDDDDAEE